MEAAQTVSQIPSRVSPRTSSRRTQTRQSFTRKSKSKTIAQHFRLFTTVVVAVVVLRTTEGSNEDMSISLCLARTRSSREKVLEISFETDGFPNESFSKFIHLSLYTHTHTHASAHRIMSVTSSSSKVIFCFHSRCKVTGRNPPFRRPHQRRSFGKSSSSSVSSQQELVLFQFDEETVPSGEWEGHMVDFVVDDGDETSERFETSRPRGASRVRRLGGRRLRLADAVRDESHWRGRCRCV